MYCSSPDPCAGRTQISGKMGGATQSTKRAVLALKGQRLLCFLEDEQTSSAQPGPGHG